MRAGRRLMMCAALSVGTAAHGQEDAAPTADPTGPIGVFDFRISDEASGALMPGRLTFTPTPTPSDGNRQLLFVNPDARPDDGLIDVCIVDRMGPGGVLTILPRAFNGSHLSRPQVTMLRTESLAIETRGNYPMHIDGELVERTPARLDITVRKMALPVLCNEHGTNRLQNPLEKII